MTDELDPRLAAALRDVVPADDDVRELHITTALAEIRRPVTRPLTKIVGVAAALLLVLGGVTVLRSGQSPTDSGLSAAEHSTVSLPSKTGTDVPATNTDPATPSDCRSNLEDSLRVGDFDFANHRRAVSMNSDSMEVVDADTCELIATFTFPVLPRTQTVCIPSLNVGTQLVGSFENASTRVIVLATDDELSVLGGPRCEVLARFPQPASK